MLTMSDDARRERNGRLRALLKTLDEHSPGEAAHADRVAVYAVATGEKMGMAAEDLLFLKEAALLHDLGKLGISQTLLHKKGSITAEDLEQLRRHAALFSDIDKPDGFQACAPIVRHHHERWDGQGYPDGLRGDQIPLSSRVLAVAETFDALAHRVGWKEAISEEEALAEIRKASGSQFDPKVVEAFLLVQPLIQPLI